LKENHVNAAQLMASISSIIIALDMQDIIVEWNRCAEKSFGLTRKQVIGKKLSECPINWDIKKVSREIDLCKTSGQKGSLDDVRLTRQNKKARLLGLSFNPIMGVAGKFRGVLIYASDITKRRHLESQLAQAQKLESIGQLAAGIAHEINTPTQYVGDNTRFLKEAFEDMNRVLKSYGQLFDAVKKTAVSDNLIQEVERVVQETDLTYLMEEIPTAIGQTIEGVERVAEIVRSMKEFSHPGVDEKTSVDINRALENTITVARNEWKYVADMKTEFEADLPLIACLPGALNQVFLNIIINAAHAISEDRNDDPGSKGIITTSTRSNGSSVEIRISDTGQGIPENIQPRVFDPFFTSKEVGRGTGQGLAISHSVIVEKHGGSISFETETGKGTTFIIQLPIQIGEE
jgi:PAS domain S-box-containing protein